jgi:PAS domain S-box-containing protein
MKTKKIKALIIEDSEDDLKLLLRELNKSSYKIIYKSVQDAKGVETALKEDWDVIISDYSLPGFSGPEALKMCNEKGIDIPFIIVSGTVGEDIAVDTMKYGAKDYIMKNNLIRLLPAIEREITDAKIRRERKLAEEALRESEERYRILIETMHDGVMHVDNNDKILFVNDSMCEMLGYKSRELVGKIGINTIIFEDDRGIVRNKNSLREKGISDKYEVRGVKKNGDIIWLNINGTPLADNSGKVIGSVGFLSDITEQKQAEEVLRNSEEKYRKLIDQSPDGIFIIDINGKFLSVNKGMIQNLKYSNEEFLSKNIWDIVPKDYLILHENRLSRILSGENINEPAEYLIKGKDGREFFVEVLSTPYFENNKIIGLQGIARDITDRKRAEELLRESEERYRKVVNISPEAIIIHSDGKIVFVNSASLQILGASNFDDLLGKSAIEFVHPDDRDFVGKRISEIIKSGNSSPWVEERFIKMDGSIIYVETIGTPTTYHGKTAVQVIIRDISERKLAEEALRVSEKDFHSLAESMPQIVWVTRADGWNIYFNQRWVDYTGLTLEESYGHGWNVPFHPDDQQRAWNAWQNATKNNATYSINCRLRRSDGEYYWWLVRGVPLINESGEIIKWFGTCTDIEDIMQTEETLRKAKEHAEESDRLKSAFLANMSHEIRTPMNGILGFADLLKEPKLTREEHQKFISIIEKSGARMLNIINDIVDISKIESGQMEVSISEININEQIEYIYTFFKPEVEGKGMQINFQNTLPSKEAIINTDKEKIYAILSNLVKNAIKYCDSGTIEIGYNLKDKYLEFFVKDTGIGIPKDRQEAIFERFIQADIADIRALQGAGLGLSISKAYAEILGGKIWVESEEGKGSVFYFTIPYNAGTKEKTVIKNVVTAKNKEGEIKKLKILIAEDDETSGLYIKLAVKKFSKEILKVKTGAEAVEVCLKNKDIDLVLMDIKMPGMNGYEASRQIRQFNKEVVIIAQTAYALMGDREKAIEAGCNDYISKPINQDLLEELIKKIF